MGDTTVSSNIEEINPEGLNEEPKFRVQPFYKRKKFLLVKPDDYTAEQLEVRPIGKTKGKDVFFSRQKSPKDVNSDTLLNFLKCYYRKVCPQCGIVRAYSSSLLDHIVTTHLSSERVASDCLYFYFMPLHYNSGVKSAKVPVLLPGSGEILVLTTEPKEAVLCMEIHMYALMKRSLKSLIPILDKLPSNKENKIRMKCYQAHLQEISETHASNKDKLFKMQDDRLLDINGLFKVTNPPGQMCFSENDDMSSTYVPEDVEEDENILQQIAMQQTWTGESEMDSDDNILDIGNDWDNTDDSGDDTDEILNVEWEVDDNIEDAEDVMLNRSDKESRLTEKDLLDESHSRESLSNQDDCCTSSDEQPQASPKAKRLKRNMETTSAEYSKIAFNSDMFKKGSNSNAGHSPQVNETTEHKYKTGKKEQCRVNPESSGEDSSDADMEELLKMLKKQN